MNILLPFFEALFWSLIGGTLFNYLLSFKFFIQNKNKYNEYTWDSFKYAHYMLLITVVSFSVVFGIKY